MIMRVLLDTVNRGKSRKLRVNAARKFTVETSIVGDMAAATGLLSDDIAQAISESAENVRNYVMSSRTFVENSNWHRRISL